MRRWLFYIFCFLITLHSFGQECPNLLEPLPGSTNVSINTSISWEKVIGITGYIINIGTTPGGGEIILEQPVGSDTTYTPPLGLPENTLIYVTITLFFFDQNNIVCPSQSFTTEDVTTVPDCTQLTVPLDGAENVNVGTNISWSYAPRALGYRITLGTSPGLGDIINNLDVGNTLSYNPTVNFPPGTTIYVRVIPYNENGNAVGCMEESFTTGALGKPPGCTHLITPVDGEINVELSPLLEWEVVLNAIGYKLFIGRSPFVNDIINGDIFTANWTFVIEFEPNKTYYVRIIPFNDAGEAQDCPQESFSTILGCGPFIDVTTGELVSFNPEINFPDRVGICENNIPTRINTSDEADGFRWFKVLPSGEEELISEEPYVDLFTAGRYRYEAYNILNQEGFVIECSSTKEFTAVLSSAAIIERPVIEEIARLFYVTILVSGPGDYEYSLNDIEGPYDDDNRFTGLGVGTYTIYVRDKNGCGISERTFKLAYPPTGFPPYFSPNGDGINDYWQYVRPEVDPLPVTLIYIYDRYGKALVNFNAQSQGWDGRYHNNTMPATEYWYKAFTRDNLIYTGHFSLIR